MGFKTENTITAIPAKESNSTFVSPEIPRTYFAVTIFMGIIASTDINIPTLVLLFLSAFVFYSLLVKAMVKPVFGVVALAAFIPYSKAVAGNLGGMIPGMNYTTVLTLISLIGFFANEKTIQKYKVLPLEASFRRLIFLFCFIAAVSVMHTEIAGGFNSFFSALVEYKRWFDPLMIFFLCSYLVQEEEDAKKIIYMMAFTLVIIGIGSVWQRHALDNRSHYVRLVGIAGQSNTTGAFYANYIFIMLGYFVMKGMKFLKRGFFLLGIAGCLLGLFATQSRGDALGVVGGLLVFFLLRNKLQLILYVAIIIFMAYNPQFLPGGLKQRVERTIQQQSGYGFSHKTKLDPSARARLELWKGAVRMIADNPVLGVGYERFQDFIYGYVDHNENTADLELKKRDGHNAYLMIGAEMGLPALIVFLIIIGFMFRIAWKSYCISPDIYWKTISICALCSISSLAITNMFGSRVFSLVLTGYLWALLAILLKMPRWAAQRNGKSGMIEIDYPIMNPRPNLSRL